MIARLFCRLFHRRVMWPVNGGYICRTCLRRWAVRWNG